MKENTTALPALRSIFFLILTCQLLASCSLFKAKTSDKGKIPSAYNTTKAISNQEARLNYVDRFKGIAIRLFQQA